MVEVLAVAHHLEQQRDDAVAAVDGVLVHTERVIVHGRSGDVKVGEQRTLGGIVRFCTLANNLIESVALEGFVYQHGAGERDGVLAEHYHGIVCRSVVGAHLHAGGLGAVSQIGIQPVCRGLLAEVAHGSDGIHGGCVISSVFGSIIRSLVSTGVKHVAR